MTVRGKKNARISIQFYSFMLALGLVALLSGGCDWFEDDDDNASSGGAGTTTTATPTPAPTSAPEPAPQPAPQPEPTPQPTPTQKDDKSYPSLAGTGIVWKPISEGNHNLVVLTPTSYGNPGAVVLDTNNQPIEAGRYVGHTNGNRATYRFNRPGGSFPAPCRLKVGGSIFTVAHPASRYN